MVFFSGKSSIRVLVKPFITFFVILKKGYEREFPPSFFKKMTLKDFRGTLFSNTDHMLVFHPFVQRFVVTHFREYQYRNEIFLLLILVD